MKIKQQQEMNKISKHTFELGKALVEISNASTRLSVLSKDMGAQYTMKATMKRWVNNLDSILRDLKSKIGSDEFKKIMEDQLLNDEDTLQINAIVDYVISLPKGIRNEIEDYTEQRYNVYAAK